MDASAHTVATMFCCLPHSKAKDELILNITFACCFVVCLRIKKYF